MNLKVSVYYPNLQEPVIYGAIDSAILIEIAFENNHYFLLKRNNDKEAINQHNLEGLCNGYAIESKPTNKLDDSSKDKQSTIVNSSTTSKSSTTSIKFICPAKGCNLEFTKYGTSSSHKSRRCAEFRAHFKKAHKKFDQIKCKNNGCARSFNSSTTNPIRDFIKHITHCKLRYECRICKKDLKTDTYLKVHILQHKYDKEIEHCSICGKTIEGKIIGNYKFIRAIEALKQHEEECRLNVAYAYNLTALLNDERKKNIYNIILLLFLLNALLLI